MSRSVKSPVFGRRKARPSLSLTAGTPLRLEAIRRYTGFESPEWRKHIRALAPHRCVIDERSVTGAAPKDFIYLYERGLSVDPRNHLTWPAYIAKVGHKNYPSESITEQLITRLGQTIGVSVADSRLIASNDQIRFLSRYFLTEGEMMLTHGAEILSGYLNDETFVRQVAEDKQDKVTFTFQELCHAIKYVYPGQLEAILGGVVRMIGFDALVGNMDRHIYNWGVVSSPTGSFPARFSPIFDTARGLFWNISEEGLTKFETPRQLAKYVNEAKPQIGWDGAGEDINHFQLLQRVAALHGRYGRILAGLVSNQTLEKCVAVINSEFRELFSTQRRELIVLCLRTRFEAYQAILREAAC